MSIMCSRKTCCLQTCFFLRTRLAPVAQALSRPYGQLLGENEERESIFKFLLYPPSLNTHSLGQTPAESGEDAS